jgi:pimeloyl-ACP methyl ester carboxylesterase
MQIALLALVATAALAWDSDEITVEPRRSAAANAPWQQSLASLDRPTERTRETLKRYDLEPRFRRDPDGTMASLERTARNAPDPDLVYALAELSWVEARRLDRRRRAAALDRYVDAVAYAYDFLFDPELAGGRQPADPRFRLAMDLYNGGLDHIIRAAQTRGRIEPGGSITLKVHGRELKLRVGLDRSPWTAEDIHELHLCSDYEVVGLQTRTYQYGLGVPLIGVRKTEQTGQSQDRFYPPEMAFPLTAFLRPNSRLRDPSNDVDDVRACTLDLLDPVQIRSVRLGDAALAVEADLTTPLAYMWSRTDLSRYRWTGLLRPGKVADRAGLMLLRPYEPDKVPVVMVHGLASSPLAWIPMINELLRDPQIQKNYQFLLYVYPTGMPIPIAASGLRDALLEAGREFGSGASLPAFGHMVLLGHSMGGLLSHAMVVDSGNRFWELNSDRPFSEMLGPPEVIEEIRHYTFFQPMPFVQRVVFLATPHRGSEMSRRPIGRVSSSLISEPDKYSDLLNQLIKDNPEAFDRRRFRRLPTSIDTLEPDSPVLQALLKMKPRSGVQFHSIIGQLRGGPPDGSSDGVVPYRSSHLDWVPEENEKRVRSDHGVQKDSEAIREVRRILLLHLAATPAVQAASQPLLVK